MQRTLLTICLALTLATAGAQTLTSDQQALMSELSIYLQTQGYQPQRVSACELAFEGQGIPYLFTLSATDTYPKYLTLQTTYNLPETYDPAYLTLTAARLNTGRGVKCLSAGRMLTFRSEWYLHDIMPVRAGFTRVVSQIEQLCTDFQATYAEVQYATTPAQPSGIKNGVPGRNEPSAQQGVAMSDPAGRSASTQSAYGSPAGAYASQPAPAYDSPQTASPETQQPLPGQPYDPTRAATPTYAQGTTTDGYATASAAGAGHQSSQASPAYGADQSGSAYAPGQTSSAYGPGQTPAAAPLAPASEPTQAEQPPLIYDNPTVGSHDERRLTLDRVTIQPDCTILDFTSHNKSGGISYSWCSIQQNAYIKVGAVEYRLVRAERIAISPKVTYYSSDDATLTFRLFFPAIPRTTQTLDFADGVDSWWMKDIRLR